MKKVFNPPLIPLTTKYPFIEPKCDRPNLKVECYKCGSVNVWTQVHVSAYAWVNVNTLECEEPEDASCSWEDVKDGEFYWCHECGHEWEVDIFAQDL